MATDTPTPDGTQSVPPGVPTRSVGTREKGAIALALFLAAVIVFRPAIDCEFINLDDPAYVQNNPIVRGSVADAFTRTHAGYWIPLTWLSYQLDYNLHLLNPAGYHRTNVLLHALTAALLFLVLCRMTQAPGRSFAVAALFAFHPVQVESVAWVTERKDVLSTLFLVLTLGAYVRYAAQPGPGRMLLVVLCFVLGLMAKPMLVTLPVVLLLLDYWPLRRKESPFVLVAEKIPLFLLAIAAGVLTIQTQHQGTAVRSLDEFSLYARMGNALMNYVIYLRMLVWPYPLAVFYPHPGELPVWEVIAATGAIGTITGVAFVLRNRSPYLLVGWLWYAITLAPVSGVIQAGWQGRADRFLYVPAIGLFLLASWGLAELAVWARKRWVAGLVCGLATSGCLVMTTIQLRHWRDSITLWEHTVGVTEPNFTALDSLAAALLDRDRIEEAITYLDAARPLSWDHELAWYLSGVAYLKQNNLSAAIYSLDIALVFSPNYLEAIALYVEIHVLMEDIERAEEEALRALQIGPRSATALKSLAVVRLKQERLDEALQCLRQAVEYDPHALGVRVKLIEELRRAGHNDEADQNERELRRFYPGWKKPE